MNKKNEIGITLIALIITIIVMLVLAAVTIQVVIKSGLLSSASKVGKDYKTAAEEEATMNKINIAGTEYNSIDEYIQNMCYHEYGDWQITKEPNCIEEGERTEICKLCRKTKTETMPVNGKHIFSGGVCIICGATGPKVGDYVNYTPTSGTYKVGSDATGYTGTDAPNPQTFTTETGEKTLKWRILSVNESTREVELVAATQTESVLYLESATGYNHGVDILNDLCKDLYSNKEIGAVARSINIEDIQAKLTYDLNNYTNTNYGYQYGITKQQMINYIEGKRKYPNLYKKELGSTSAGLEATDPNLITGSEGLNNRIKNETTGISTYKDVTIDANDGAANATASIYTTYTYAYYYPENYLRTDLGLNNPVAGIFNTGTTYWLASRCVAAGVSQSEFALRYVNASQYIGCRDLILSTGEIYSPGIAIRPSVYLPSSILMTLDSKNTTDSVTYWDIK